MSWSYVEILRKVPDITEEALRNFATIIPGNRRPSVYEIQHGPRGPEFWDTPHAIQYQQFADGDERKYLRELEGRSIRFLCQTPREFLAQRDHILRESGFDHTRLGVSMDRYCEYQLSSEERRELWKTQLFPLFEKFIEGRYTPRDLQAHLWDEETLLFALVLRKHIPIDKLPELRKIA